MEQFSVGLNVSLLRWSLTQVAVEKFDVHVHENHLDVDLENLDAIYIR